MTARKPGAVRGRPPNPWKGQSQYAPWSLAQFLYDFPGGTRAAMSLLQDIKGSDVVARKFFDAWAAEQQGFARASLSDKICRKNNINPIDVRKCLTKALAAYASDRAKIIQSESLVELTRASVKAATDGGTDAADERRAHLEKHDVLNQPKKGDINITSQTLVGGGRDFSAWLAEADQPNQLPPAFDAVGEIVNDEAGETSS